MPGSTIELHGAHVPTSKYPAFCAATAAGGWSAAHALVIERLLLLIERDLDRAVPRAFLHRDLVAERADELVSLGRREAAELDHGALTTDRGNLGAGILDEHRAKPVEIRLASV